MLNETEYVANQQKLLMQVPNNNDGRLCVQATKSVLVSLNEVHVSRLLLDLNCLDTAAYMCEMMRIFIIAHAHVKGCDDNGIT